MTQCDWFSAHTKPLYLLSILWVRPEHGIRVCVSTCVCVLACIGPTHYPARMHHTHTWRQLLRGGVYKVTLFCRSGVRRLSLLSACRVPAGGKCHLFCCSNEWHSCNITCKLVITLHICCHCQSLSRIFKDSVQDALFSLNYKA